jgi:hypothetical protein
MDNGWGKHGNGYEICKQVGNPRGPDWGKVMALAWGKLLALGGECYWPVTLWDAFVC